MFVAGLPEMKAVLEYNPFTAEKEGGTSTLHLTVLSEEPAPEAIDSLKGNLYVPDAFVSAGRFIYLACPNGYGKTRLTNTFFENKFKVRATTRNWKIVIELVRLATAIH